MTISVFLFSIAASVIAAVVYDFCKHLIKGSRNDRLGITGHCDEDICILSI